MEREQEESKEEELKKAEKRMERSKVECVSCSAANVELPHRITPRRAFFLIVVSAIVGGAVAVAVAGRIAEEWQWLIGVTSLVFLLGFILWAVFLFYVYFLPHRWLPRLVVWGIPIVSVAEIICTLLFLAYSVLLWFALFALLVGVLQLLLWWSVLRRFSLLKVFPWWIPDRSIWILWAFKLLVLLGLLILLFNSLTFLLAWWWLLLLFLLFGIGIDHGGRRKKKCKVRIVGPDCLCSKGQSEMYSAEGDPEGACTWDIRGPFQITWSGGCVVSVRAIGIGVGTLAVSYTTREGKTCNATKNVKAAAPGPIIGPDFVCKDGMASFEITTNPPGCEHLIEWIGDGSNLSGRGATYTTGFRSAGDKVVTARCGGARDTAQHKTVKVVEVLIDGPTEVSVNERIAVVAHPSHPGGTFVWGSNSTKIDLVGPNGQDNIAVKGRATSNAPGDAEVTVTYEIGGIRCTARRGVTVIDARCDPQNIKDQIRTLVLHWESGEQGAIALREGRARDAANRFIDIIGGAIGEITNLSRPTVNVIWAMSKAVRVSLPTVIIGILIDILADPSATVAHLKKEYRQRLEALTRRAREDLQREVERLIGSQNSELVRADDDCDLLKRLLEEVSRLYPSHVESSDEALRELLFEYARARGWQIYVKHPTHWNRWYSPGYYGPTYTEIPLMFDGSDLIDALNELPPPW